MELLGDILEAGVTLMWGAMFLTVMGILFLVPLVLVVFTIVDIFNREDLGAGKLVWLLIVLLVPLIGLAMYWLAKPSGPETFPAALHRATPVAEEEPRSQPARAA